VVLLAANNSPRLSSQQRRWVMLTLCIGAFMGALDAGLVIISLPRIAQQLHCSMADISWILIAILTTSGSMLILFGWLGDMVPPGRLYLLGLLIFIFASSFCYLSPSWFWLVVSRGLLGISGALLLALSPKIIVQLYAVGERGTPFGWISFSLAIGGAMGCPLGGVITSHLSWHFIFVINILLGCFTLIFGCRVLVTLPAGKSLGGKVHALIGGLILAVSLIFLFLALGGLSELGRLSLKAWGSLGFAVGLFGILVLWENRHGLEFLQPEIWRSRVFLFGTLGLLIINAAFQGTLFLLPFFLEHIFLYSPYQSGIMLAVVGVFGAFGSYIAGHMADRFGNVRVVRIALLIILLGLTPMLITGPENPSFVLIGQLGLIRVGYGAFLPANFNEIMRFINPKISGLAASSAYLLKKIGAILGINLIVLAFSWLELHHIVLKEGFYLKLEHFRLAFATMIVIGSINLLIYFVLFRSKPPS